LVFFGSNPKLGNKKRKEIEENISVHVLTSKKTFALLLAVME
jgi:hypothetical protein